MFLLNPDGTGGVHAPPQVVLEYSPMVPSMPQTIGASGHVHSEENTSTHVALKEWASSSVRGESEDIQETSMERPDILETSMERTSCVTTRKVRWDSKEIGSFVQLLGLLDQKKTQKYVENIMKFQNLNEVSRHKF